MDGLKGVIPNTCHDTVEEIPSLFGDSDKVVTRCKGCEKDDIHKHNGIRCMIKDWSARKTFQFVDLLKP